MANARCLADALRALGLRPAGGNHRTLKKLIERYGIPTDHFDPDGIRRRSLHHRPMPLCEVLVEESTYNRTKLKSRLYEAGLKLRRCELCGQDETWNGRTMSLILDHINGVPTDNRLENLRIVCPNCAATLDTHCGRKNRLDIRPRPCKRCGNEFIPRYPKHRYCSRACGQRSHERDRSPKPERRKVERPPYDQLLAEIEETSYLAVGRKYGVSDRAVRKWIRYYTYQEEMAAWRAESAAQDQKAA